MDQPASVQEPVLTQTLKMHLNGGSKFSERVVEILADEKPTGITIHTSTNGRPQYLITAKVIRYRDEEFDLMAATGEDPMEWIRARLPGRS